MTGRIIRTAFSVLLRPRGFFRELSEYYAVRPAFIFYCVLFVVIPCALFFAAAAALILAGAPIGKAVLTTIVPILIAVLAYGVISIAAIFVIAIIMHAFVLLFRGKGRFSGTFNVLVFSNTAALLYQILAASAIFSIILLKSWNLFLPVMIITLLGALWLITIPVIGYKTIHMMGTFRASAAFFIPAILWLGISYVGYSEMNKLNKVNMKMPTIEEVKAALLPVKQQQDALPAPTPSSINWRYNLNDALSIAAKEGKPLMVDFYTDWCSWCKKLDQDTYSDQSIRALSEKFVSVKINADRDKDSTMRYDVRGYPTIIFLGPNGSVANKTSGYIEAGRLSAIMKDVSAKYPAKKEDMKLGLTIPFKGFTPKYRLTAIGSLGGRPNAIINDMIVYAGDSIGDAKVVSIKNDRVILRCNDEEVVLELK